VSVLSRYDISSYLETYIKTITPLFSVFVLEIDPDTSKAEIPEAILACTRLILLETEWERAKTKGKAPKAKADAQTLQVLKDVLKRRLEDYPTTLQVRTFLSAPLAGGLIDANRRTTKTHSNHRLTCCLLTNDMHL